MMVPDRSELKLMVWETMRYWEPRRVLYNLVLLVSTVRNFYDDGVADRLLQPPILLILCGLALGANLAYCAAYVVDLLARLTPLKNVWLKLRWLLFLLGLGLASALAYQETGFLTGQVRMV